MGKLEKTVIITGVIITVSVLIVTAISYMPRQEVSNVKPGVVTTFHEPVMQHTIDGSQLQGGSF